jgi:hypothetical protein
MIHRLAPKLGVAPHDGPARSECLAGAQRNRTWGSPAGRLDGAAIPMCRGRLVPSCGGCDVASWHFPGPPEASDVSPMSGGLQLIA